MIETGELVWCKASASSATGSDCVEVAELEHGGRAVRDSKRPDGPILRYPAGEWRAFVEGVRADAFA